MNAYQELQDQYLVQTYFRNLAIRGAIPNPFCCSTVAAMKDGCVQVQMLNDQPAWVSIEYKLKFELIRKVHYCPFCGTKLPEFQQKADPPDQDLPEIAAWEAKDAPPISFVGAYIVRGPKDEVLSVSRKDNPASKGLPGGKVEPGETLFETLVREIREETGLTVKDAFPVFDAKDDTGIRGVTFFVTDYEGEVHTQEAGVVEWISHKRLVTESKFPSYNNALIDRLDFTHLLLSDDDDTVG